MDNEQLIEEFIAETWKNGGATVSLTGRPAPTYGYMVGGIAPAMTFPSIVLRMNKYEQLSPELRGYIRANQALLLQPDIYLGSWVDEETHLLWIDISQRTITKEFGEVLARERHEIAIWDVVNKKEILV